jgi:hypothetical protein
MRVLFADDQIPSQSDAENEKFNEELRKELSGKLVDFESAYGEDYEWFTELVRYLSVDMGFKLTKAKSFAKAKELAQNRGDYNVAVIDLSWTGDPALTREEKKNSGLEILRLIADGNKAAGLYKPTIAFSQNYKTDPELFAKVLEADALPIPKEYTPTGHRTLGAAIRLMGARLDSGRFAPGMKWPEATVGEILKSLTVAQSWSIFATLVSVLACVAGFAYWLGAAHFGHP